MKTPALPSRQRGVALITAMLVVALAVIAASAMVVSNNVALHRASVFQDSERAWWYATGLESWVKTILQLDATTNNYDGLTDAWAMSVPVLPVDNGALSGKIMDLQGRFNLNNLGNTNAEQQRRSQQLFVRLLEQLKIGPGQAEQIASAIHDWVDADAIPSPPSGAEDNDYMGLTPSYRAANRMMQSVSELHAIKGITPQIYKALAPYVSALPQTNLAVNVNTAPELLVAAVFGGTGPNPKLTAFLQERELEPAADTRGLVESGLITGTSSVDNSLISTRSNYFQLRAQAQIGESRVAIYSVYYRPQRGLPLVLLRSTDGE